MTDDQYSSLPDVSGERAHQGISQKYVSGADRTEQAPYDRTGARPEQTRPDQRRPVERRARQTVAMAETPLKSLVACHECDWLHEKSEIKVGEVARCVRCNATLYNKKDNSIDRALAVGLAALIMFVLANCFPFLDISVSGRQQNMSIVSTIHALSGEGLWLLGLVSFGFILLFPLMRMTGLLYILLPLRFNSRLPGMEFVFRMIVRLSPWSMMEIYLFGAIVALVKLASMASIGLGYSFWAFALLNIFTAASLQLIDNHSLWELISESREHDDLQPDGVSV